jgi:hypothetical protein
MKNLMLEFEDIGENTWQMSMNNRGCHMGLESLTLGYQILQTEVGSVDEVLEEARFLQKRIKEKPASFKKLMNMLKVYNSYLNSTGDVHFLDKISDTIKSFKEELQND